MRAIILAMVLTGCSTMQAMMDKPNYTPKWKMDTAAVVAFTGALYVASQMGHGGHDKYQHCAVGATSALTVGLVWENPKAGWIVGASLGAAKEAYDANGGGEASEADFGWTAGCAAVPYFVMEQFGG